MNLSRLNYSISKDFPPLVLLGDFLHTGDDFYVSSNAYVNHYDYLIFFDSRGFSGSFDQSLAGLITKHLSLNNLSYLILVRPLPLTMWISLYNFLTLNSFSFENLITNVGFVDFTPKKLNILKSASLQFQSLPSNSQPSIISSGSFQLKSGLTESLYTFLFPSSFTDLLNNALNTFSSSFVLATPYFSPEIPLERVRPPAFYTGINFSNNYNASLNVTVVNLPPFGKSHCYDAVHYSTLGNAVVFQSLVKFF